MQVIDVLLALLELLSIEVASNWWRENWASTTNGYTYRFQGRGFRLTDVHGRVVKDILT